MKRRFFDCLIAGILFAVLTGCGAKPTVLTAPQHVTDLKAVFEEGKIVLTWKDPSDTNLLGIKIYNGIYSQARSVSFADGILVGAGLERYEVTNLLDGESYTFSVTAVNTDLLESQKVTTEEVTFNLKVVEKEVEKPVDIFICSVDGKKYDSLEGAISCCSEKIMTVSSVKPGEYNVYHLLQNLEGSTAILDYGLSESESELTVIEDSDIQTIAKTYVGFEPVSMALQEDSLYVLYNRKFVTYTFETGISGSFENGGNSLPVSGLYGTSVEMPDNPSGDYQFVRWNDSERKEVPGVFGDEDKTFSAVWIDFIKIEYEGGDFYISRAETTNAWWLEVYNWALENGYSFVKHTISAGDGLNIPVINVSWRNAVVWCNAASEKAGLVPVYEYNGEVLRSLEGSPSGYGSGYAELATINKGANGYRLPTLAEWQYAAKGGENYIYSGSDNPDEVSWYGNNEGTGGNSLGKKQEVMTLKPNGYGIYDMSGNVWEWVQNEEASSDGKNEHYRVMCGGSIWGFPSDGEITNFQTREPSKAGSSFGFRLVRNIPSASSSE